MHRKMDVDIRNNYWEFETLELIETLEIIIGIIFYMINALKNRINIFTTLTLNLIHELIQMLTMKLDLSHLVQ